MNEHDDPLHFDIDRSQLTPQTKPGMAGHEWRQQGPYLRCNSCPLSHAVYVGIEVMLVGFDETGLPVLKRMR